MHNTHGMTIVNNADHLPAESRRRTFGIKPLGNYPIEELATLAQLHDQMHTFLILVHSNKLDDVPVTGQMVHDLNLPSYILDVVLPHQLPRRDRLARVDFLRLSVCNEMGHSELASTQLPPEGVHVFHVLRLPGEHFADASRTRREDASVSPGGFVGVLVCSAAGVVAHCLDWRAALGVVGFFVI